jgi:hypothetical protein
MATKLKVTYLDGRVVEVRTTPRGQIMTERHLKGVTEQNKLQAAYFLAWLSLKKAGEEEAEYESWLDLIDDVEEATPDGEVDEDLDPTQPGVTPDSSSS